MRVTQHCWRFHSDLFSCWTFTHFVRIWAMRSQIHISLSFLKFSIEDSQSVWLLSKRKKDSLKVETPNTCPSCSSKLVKSKSEAILRCNAGTNCPAQKTESIRHYVSRNALNIDGLGEKIIELLVQTELISDFSDLYTLKRKVIK